MLNMLLQSCSASKNEVTAPTPASELYSGYFYKIINKSKREGEFREDTEITILSAKYGILDPEESIEYYDQRMDSSRAEELNEEVVDSLVQRINSNNYDRIVINMGKSYRTALKGLSERVDIPVEVIPGDGIGEKGHSLYQFIRGDDSVVEEIDDV